jgi:hypothetical protein
MKLQITHLKAPWPEGARVGDVVEVKGDKVPDWAVGKCTQAADNASATIEYPPKTEQQKLDAEPASQRAAEAMADARTFVENMRREHAAEVQRLRDDIDSGGRALQEALAENDRLRAQIDAAAAETDDAKSAAAVRAANKQAADERAAAAARATAAAAGKPGKPAKG